VQDSARRCIHAGIYLLNGREYGSATIRPGERSAAFTLDWPSDAKGKRVDVVSRCRIAHRIDANGAETEHGILSVGVIAASLMWLRVVYLKQIVPC